MSTIFYFSIKFFSIQNTLYQVFVSSLTLECVSMKGVGYLLILVEGLLELCHLGKNCDKHTLYIGIGDVGIDDVAVLVLACLVAVVGLNITVATALSVEL